MKDQSYIISTTKYKIFILLFSVIFFHFTSSAQLEKVIVETYYVSDQFDSTDIDLNGKRLEMGSVTYRLYVDLKPGSKLLNLYGDKYHPLKFSSTKPFFNNIDGETYAKDIKKANYAYNTFALDTWLTLGQTAKTQAGKTYFGILKNQDHSGSFIGGANNDGGSAMIANGLLSNTQTPIGIPLTVEDGMDTLAIFSASWQAIGIKDFLTSVDSTIFGSVVSKSEFINHNTYLKNTGATGVVRDSNQILIAQLTTKGQLSFELNLEIEELVNNVPTVVKYVGNSDTLLPGEKVSRYLKYPFGPPVCGCIDPLYFEYTPGLECYDNKKYCQTLVVYGCKDTMACNYDPKVNYSIPMLCCYPGSCNGRDITVVCPKVNGEKYEFSIHPNPAQNTLFLNISSGTEELISYAVFDYTGTLVVSKDLGLTQSVVNEEVDLSTLPQGLYLLRLKVGNVFKSTQFIKN